MDFTNANLAFPAVMTVASFVGGSIVWLLVRKTHDAKDALAQRTEELSSRTVSLLTTQNASLSEANTDLRRQNTELRAKVQEHTTELGELRADLARVTALLTQRAEVAELARAMSFGFERSFKQIVRLDERTEERHKVYTEGIRSVLNAIKTVEDGMEHPHHLT